MDSFTCGKIIASIPFVILVCVGFGLLFFDREQIKTSNRWKVGVSLLVAGCIGLLIVYSINPLLSARS